MGIGNQGGEGRVSGVPARGEPQQLQGRPTQAVQEGGGRVSGIPAREGATTAKLQGRPTQAAQEGGGRVSGVPARGEPPQLRQQWTRQRRSAPVHWL